MKESTKRRIAFWTGFELADRLSAFLGFDVEEMKKARERHKIAYYIGIAIPFVMIVVAVVMQFARR